MPMADMLIDAASGHYILSLIDGHSSYNLIKIKEIDVSKMALRCPGALGSYKWVIMPFGPQIQAMSVMVRGANRSWLTARVDGRYDVLDGEVILSYTNG